MARILLRARQGRSKQLPVPVTLGGQGALLKRVYDGGLEDDGLRAQGEYLGSDNSCAICCVTSRVVDKVCIVPSICVLLSCEEARLAFGKSRRSAARNRGVLGFGSCSARTRRGNCGRNKAACRDKCLVGVDIRYC